MSRIVCNRRTHTYDWWAFKYYKEASVQMQSFL